MFVLSGREKKNSTDLKSHRIEGDQEIGFSLALLNGTSGWEVWDVLEWPARCSGSWRKKTQLFWKEDNKSFSKHCFGFLQREVWRVPDIFVCC